MASNEKAFYFHIGEEPYVLKDCFYMTQEKFDSLTAEEIQAIKMERYTNWYNIVTADIPNSPPAEQSPTFTPMYDWTPGQEPSAELVAQLSNNAIVNTNSVSIISDLAAI